MAKFKGKFLCVLAFSVCSLFILGCNSNKKEVPSNMAENINLNSGAVLKSENGDYNLYDYSEKYTKQETDKLVLTYDKSSSNYVYRKNGETFAVYNEKEIKIEDSEYIKLKLSPGGSYVSYFVDDNGMKLKIINLKENKFAEIKSNVSISGTLYDWYDNKSLVYYGVSEDGVNGLFIYNIEDDKEELLYKLKEGYLAYLKGTIDNILFLQLNFDNERQFIALNKNTKDIEILNNNIEEIKDVVYLNNDVFFVGRVKDNVNSLYKIENGNTKRVAYDFPAVIDTGKGIEADSENNILFIGKNNPSSGQEQVFKYSKDGSISSISDGSSDYAFVEYVE